MLSFLIEFEGYRARIERDRDGVCHGRVIEIDEVINFKAGSMRMMESKFATALGLYFVKCKEQGVEPQRPVSSF